MKNIQLTSLVARAVIYLTQMALAFKIQRHSILLFDCRLSGIYLIAFYSNSHILIDVLTSLSSRPWDAVLEFVSRFKISISIDFTGSGRIELNHRKPKLLLTMLLST